MAPAAGCGSEERSRTGVAPTPPIAVVFYDSSIYATFTSTAGRSLRRAASHDLGLVCRYEPPAEDLGALPLLWRDDRGDCGYAADVTGIWSASPELAVLVRDCRVTANPDGTGRTLSRVLFIGPPTPVSE